MLERRAQRGEAHRSLGKTLPSPFLPIDRPGIIRVSMPWSPEIVL